MPNRTVIFNIQVLDNGELILTDANGKTLRELDANKLGESLSGRTIRKTTTLPTITVLESNPRWVCIGGRWYYIP